MHRGGEIAAPVIKERSNHHRHMSKTNNKWKVDMRMKPLLQKGVRVRHNTATYSIIEYDYFDNLDAYVIHVSDRVDPLEIRFADMPKYLDSLARVDGQNIPKWDDEQKPADPAKKGKAKPAVARYDEEDEEEDEVPEEVQHFVKPEMTAAKSNYPHITSTVSIYVTRDYGAFSTIVGNRTLNKNKIKRIKDEIAAGTNLLQYCPIIVTEQGGKLKVIDGQHRLEVAKQIGSNVWYVVTAALNLYEIAKMNSNTEKWKGKDFINCYAHTGNEHYVKLKEFYNVYRFPLSVCLQLLTVGYKVTDGGTDLIKQFEQGGFKVRKEDEAMSVAKQVERFAAFPAYKQRSFIIAISKVISATKIELDEVVSAFEKNADRLLPQPSWKEYLIALETIVNIGKSKRRVIY